MSHDSNPPPVAATPSAFRKLLAWLPLGLIAVEAAGLVVVSNLEANETLSPANAGLVRLSSLLLTGILLFLWFVFLSPVSRGVRTRVGVIGLLLAAAAVGLFDIKGVTGDVKPSLRFRWARRADEALPKAAAEAAESGSVDLAATTPHDYPEYLGPGRRATLVDLHLARDWTASPPKLLWRHPIGAGWSSFAVVGHFAVTQEQRGEEELVTCYDVDNGKLQWAHSTPVRFDARIAGIGPRATPTIDEGKVYVLGAMGNLDCLDGATGKPIWQHNIVTENGAALPQWGKSCSPLVYENLVIVSAGGPGGKSLVAYDKHDGKLVWSAGDDASSYSSPTVMTLGGKPQIVIVNATIAIAHDPADGRVLWQHVWPNRDAGSPNVAQPLAVGDDRVLLTKGYGVGSALWQIKLDGDSWSVDQLWEHNYLKTKMTNAVVRDGFAYGLDEGILSCVQISSGARKWKRGNYGHGQVLLVDDLLLVQSEDGQVALVEAVPDAYRELTRFTAVNGQSWNCPALAGDKLLVRTELEATCYVLPVVSP